MKSCTHGNKEKGVAFEEHIIRAENQVRGVFKQRHNIGGDCREKTVGYVIYLHFIKIGKHRNYYTIFERENKGNCMYLR